MYAQMDGILFCHWNNTHSIVLTNGKIHLVIFNCLVLVYNVQSGSCSQTGFQHDVKGRHNLAFSPTIVQINN